MVKLRAKTALEGPKILQSISDTEPRDLTESSRAHAYGADTKAAARVYVGPKGTGPAFVRGPVQRPKPDPTLRLHRLNPKKKL